MHPIGKQKADENLTDSELAHRISRGDNHAFEVLMRRCNRTLFRAARSIVKDDTEAEDVVQDAYLLAFRRIDTFRGDARLSTWLTRIVINEAIARSRKGSRRAEIIQLGGDMPWDDKTESVDAYAAEPDQPEQAVARAEASRLLEQKIDQLPDAFRTVFMLRAMEEMSVEEVATILGIAEVTVRTRFFRARSMLRETLAHEIDIAFEGAFGFAGTRCDRIVAGVKARLEKSRVGDA